MKQLNLIFGLVFIILVFSMDGPWAAEEKVRLIATVNPMGTYTFTSELATFNFARPGRYILGSVSVSLSPPHAPYNGPYPWIMKVYTNNTNYNGVAPSRAGLISNNGKFVIPLKVWCLNFGPESYTTDSFCPSVDDDKLWKDPQEAVWLRVPDINDPDYIPYQPDNTPYEYNDSDVVLVGIDPRNASWVSEENPYGNTQLIELPEKNSFRVWFATELEQVAPAGYYQGKIIIEVTEVP